MGQRTYEHKTYLDDEEQTEIQVTYRVLSSGVAPTHSYDPFVYDPGAAAEIEILSCISWPGDPVTLGQAQRDRIGAEIERYDREQWETGPDPDYALEDQRDAVHESAF